MLERRRFLRTKVFKSAKIFLAGHSAISCIVRDLSNHGACLRLTSTADFPKEFDLSFDIGHTFRKCQPRSADLYGYRRVLRAAGGALNLFVQLLYCVTTTVRGAISETISRLITFRCGVRDLLYRTPETPTGCPFVAQMRSAAMSILSPLLG